AVETRRELRDGERDLAHDLDDGPIPLTRRRGRREVEQRRRRHPGTGAHLDPVEPQGHDQVRAAEEPLPAAARPAAPVPPRARGGQADADAAARARLALHPCTLSGWRSVTRIIGERSRVARATPVAAAATPGPGAARAAPGALTRSPVTAAMTHAAASSCAST